MAADPSGLFEELRRRKVFRATAAYIVVAAGVIAVANDSFTPLGLPPWTVKFVVILAVLGLPVTIALSWAFDVRPVKPGAEGGEGEAAPAREPALRTTAGRFRSTGARIAVIGVVIIVGAAWLLIGNAASSDDGTGGRAPTIAVLPFENNSDDPEVNPLVNGIHDDLLTHLSQIGGLRVISRTSVAGYAETTKTIPQIAAELGATVILEGGVQLAGDQIRINAQLIDAESDEHLWAESYDRDYSVAGILALQSEVAGRIADALKLSLTPAGQRSIRERPTTDTEAYEHYLRGLGLMGQSAATEDVSLYPAFEREFRRAVELDPDFGLAHAALSITYSAFWYWAGDREGTRLDDARRHAELALRLAPRRWQGHYAMAFALLNEAELDGALDEAQQAARLGEGSAEALSILGLVHLERAELDAAFHAFRQASDRDPRSVLAANYVVMVATYTRRWAEAERYLERMRGLPLADSRQLSVYIVIPVGLVLARTGDLGRARAMLMEARDSLGLSPADIAIVLSSLPELIRDGAFDDVLATVGPETSDSTRRCLCRQARAVWEEQRGRGQKAREIWAAWAKARQETGVLEQPPSIQGVRRALQAFILARAGSPEAARSEMETAWSLDMTPMDRLSARAYRLQMRASLGDAEGMLQDLEWLLSRPSTLTPNEARIDPFLAPYRDDPRFREVVERYSG